MLKEERSTDAVGRCSLKGLLKRWRCRRRNHEGGTDAMKSGSRKSTWIFAILGIFPVIWFALLTAPYLSGGLMGIVKAAGGDGPSVFYGTL